MKIYLDDTRKTPDGYVRTYSVEETIDYIKTGLVEELSLDNDLGIGFREGYEVMKWLEEEVIANGFKNIPKRFRFHTDNIVRRDEMKACARNIIRFLGK